MLSAHIAKEVVEALWGRFSHQTKAEKIHTMTQVIIALRSAGFDVVRSPPVSP